MKKGIFAILAMLAVFAMISCGGGGGGGGGGGDKGPKVNITFDLNYDGAPAAKTIKVGQKVALGKDYPGMPTDAPDGKIFLSWNSEDDGNGNLVSPLSKYSADTTVYAQWADYDEDDDVIVTFDYNYGSPAFQLRKVAVKDNALASFPGTPGQAGNFFRGWFNKASGSGKARITADSTFGDDTTVYAWWALNGSTPTPENDEVRFDYFDTTFQFVVLGVDETWATVKTKLSRAADVKDEANMFKGWKKEGTDIYADADIVTPGSVITALWTPGASTATGALEKVYGENMSVAIYEFDLGTGNTVTKENLAKITAIKASYAVSEAGVAVIADRGGSLSYRAFGPYIFDSTGVKPKNGATESRQTWYGDFMLTNNDHLITRMDGTAPATPGTFQGGTFNKFHPYYIYSGGNFSNGSEGAVSTANTWVDSTMAVDATADGNRYKTILDGLEGILTDGLDVVSDSVSYRVLRAEALDTTKVYFGIGMPRRDGDDSKAKDGHQSPWEKGIIYLVKDVKITFNGTDIVGTIPSLKINPGTDDEKVIDQVFAGYAPGDISFGWRGVPTDPVVIPQGGDYVAPPSVAPALSSYTIKNPRLKQYQGNKANDGTTMIVIDGNKITFSIGEDNINNIPADSPNISKKFGGGGFQILFDDIDLPEDYRAYKNIILDVTIKGKTTDSMANRQVIFSAPGGNDLTPNGEDRKYVTIGADTAAGSSKTFSIATRNLTIGAGNDVGLAVRANNWDFSNPPDPEKNNTPIEGDITVNRITFTL